MKNKRSESITVIKGASHRASANRDESVPEWASVSMPLEVRLDRLEGESNRPAQESPAVAFMVEDPSGFGLIGAGLRDFDSLSLGSSPGVVRVGVNELGWVVYDWIPGP